MVRVAVRDATERCPDSEIVALIPSLRAFARTFCRSPTDADDLVQETLMKGIANIDKFEPGTRMKSWLFTIMRNTFITRIRKYQREAPGSLDCASARPFVAASQEWAVRGLEVQKALNRLPQDQREMIVLVAVLGTSYEDAAGICGCAIGTVKSRINRGRQTLLAELGETSTKAVVEGHARLESGALYGTSDV